MENHSPTKLWIASGNAAKARELIDFSKEFFPKMRSIEAREPKDVDENESTFQGNAKLKTYALVQELINEGYKSFTVLGDDSGLCVDILNGKPGVRSGRYSGVNSNPQRNLEKLLRDLNFATQALSERTGKYYCALWMVRVSDGEIKEEFGAEGIREGLIGLNPKGANGYAYDAVFLDPQTLLSYGEVPYAEKQRDSHRRRAFEKLITLARNI